MKMKCPACGKDTEDSALYCSTCGARLIVAPPQKKISPGQLEELRKLVELPLPPPRREQTAGWEPVPAIVPAPEPPPPQDDSRKRTELSPGTFLQNRYQVLKPLKRGGMGAIYEVYDNRLQKNWALKELIEFFINEEERKRATERFQREATILASLIHPNLLRVIDSFEEKGRFYLVMDYVQGIDLGELMKGQPQNRLPEQWVIRIAGDILKILHYLHTQRPPVVYRDLKPSNIMIREQDKSTVLVDFGIARALTPDNSPRTEIGTVGYAPPEQYSGNPLPVSDIYALGATMHELLSGVTPRVPFQFPPLREAAPAVSERLHQIVMRALELDHRNRWASAKDMYAALETIRSGGPLPEFRESDSSGISFKPETERRGSSDLPGLDTSILKPHFPQTPGPLPSSSPLNLELMPTEAISGRARSSPPSAEQLATELLSSFKSSLPKEEQSPKSTAALSPEKEKSLKKLNAYLDRFKDYLSFDGHREPVTCLVLHPRKELLASSGGDGAVKIWDLVAHKELTSFSESYKNIATIAFSADGRHIAYNSAKNRCPVYDLKTKIKITEFDKVDNVLHTIAFHPQELSIVLGYIDGEIVVYNYATQSFSRLKYYQKPLTALTLSKDGTLMITGHLDGTLMLWDYAGKKPIKSPKNHTGKINMLAAAPNDKLLASGSTDGSVILWSLQNLVPIKTLKGGTGEIFSLAFVRDNPYLCTSSEDKTIRIWDLPDGELNVVLDRNLGRVMHLTLNAYEKNTYLAAASGSLVTYWRVQESPGQLPGSGAS
ncbi:MAG: protein kinase [Candidatus Eremiobacteraeota bacterium]|nr:protein kinase [Candidatus Eremiobacteraeota bacterium]